MPVAVVLPGWLGYGAASAGPLGALAAFLRAHGLLSGGLVLPIAMARDSARLLLAAHLLVQVWAGVAVWRFGRAAGLGEAALAAALVVALAPGFLVGHAWSLAGTGFVLLAVERLVGRRRGGVWAVAGAIGLLALLAGPAGTVAGAAFGFVWGVARLVTRRHAGRARAAAGARLAVGGALGLALCWPLVALHLLFGVWGRTLVLAPPSLPDWLVRPAEPLWAGASPPLPVLAPMLPALALALMALPPVPGPRRGRGLRLVLALGSVGFLLLPGLGSVSRLPIALLAAVTLDDARRGAVSGPVARAVAAALAVLLAALSVGFGAADAVLATAEALAASAAVALAGRPGAAGTVAVMGCVFDIAWASYGGFGLRALS